MNGFYVNTPAVVKSEIELRAILDFKSLHSQVGAHEEPYGLYYKSYI